MRQAVKFVGIIESSDTRKPRVYINPNLLTSNKQELKTFFESNRFSTTSPIDAIEQLKPYGVELNVIASNKEDCSINTTILSQVITYTEKEYGETIDQMKVEMSKNRELLDSLELHTEDIETCVQLFLSTRRLGDEMIGKESNREYLRGLLAEYQRGKYTLGKLKSVRDGI